MTEFHEFLPERFEEIIQGFLDNHFAILDGFSPNPTLTAQLEERARFLFASGDFSKAGIGRGEAFTVDKQIRGDHIFWLDPKSENEAERLFLSAMESFSSYLNRTCFAGIQFYEFHFAIYPPGTFYRRHFDRFRDGDSRLFSVVFYLNHEWSAEDGGELALYPDNLDPVIVLPLANRLAFFDSATIEHEVLVAKKERLSITGWFRR